MARRIEGKQRITLELSPHIYKALEKLAYIRGSTVEYTIIELVKIFLGIVEDIDSHYTLKYSKAIDYSYDLIIKAMGEGRVKLRKKDKSFIAKNYIKPLGVIATILVDLYGRIPSSVSREDLEAKSSELTEVIARIARRGLKPIDYILSKIEKIKHIAPAFDIEILGSNNNFELIFKNPALLEGLYGVGTRPLRRKLKK